MAVLSDAERRELWAQWMRENREAVIVSKGTLRAAMNATDDWLEAGMPAFNAALAAAGASSLTAAQKARLFELAARRRMERG